jgi:hypothetical protein
MQPGETDLPELLATDLENSFRPQLIIFYIQDLKLL